MAEMEMKGIVESYFRGVERDDIKALMGLWNLEGVLKITVEPEYKGSFRGEAQISEFYNTRLEGIKKNKLKIEEKVMDIVTDKNRAKAYWRRSVETAQGYGFDLLGVHEFTFEDNKIIFLHIRSTGPAIESSKPNIGFGILSVTDVGKLSAMAWRIA